jgi:predicted rRNA methylase YqxC with S4 and FtsJ domains
LKPGENAGIVGIHAIDLDAGGFCEVAVERLVGGVMACGVKVDNLILRLRQLMSVSARAQTATRVFLYMVGYGGFVG